MALTKEQVEKVAVLARLSLSDDEIEQFRGQLSSILGYIEKLQALDVEGVPPTTHAVQVDSTPLRPDVEPAPGAKPLDQIKLIRPSTEEIEKGIPEVKELWRDTFGV